jgi:hypothetical protein
MKVTALIAALSLSMWAGQSAETWTGKISDSFCAAKHEQGEGVEEMTDAQCTTACVRGGSKYVFITDEKVYAIANQDEPNLPKLAGVDVKLTGVIKGDSITISKLEKVEN